jgi:hypothetical protein
MIDDDDGADYLSAEEGDDPPKINKAQIAVEYFTADEGDDPPKINKGQGPNQRPYF